jgi:hypothetical protein
MWYRFAKTRVVLSSLLVLGVDFLGMATVSEELSFEEGMESDREKSGLCSA